MNAAEVPFLYLPVFYWGAFVLLLYRHDLSRLTHPFRDRSEPRRWWSVLLSAGLLSAEQASKRPGKGKEVLPLLWCLLAASGLSLSWIIPVFPSTWYFLVAAQVASGLVLTMGTVWHLGPPPRGPYADMLRYPRLGSRIRHLQDPPPPCSEQPAPSEPKLDLKIRFFSVSLRNGIVVSTPSYPEKQAFVAALIRALEASDPDFAWIQFLFVKFDHSSALARLKNSIQRAKSEIQRPSQDLLSGQEHAKRELGRDFYSQTDARTRKIDEIATKPLVTLAIQGMWATSKAPSAIEALPFDHCSDEHDRLAVFQYNDPRMLRELVERRMVANIREYLDRFTKSRLEPPSFMMTPEGLQSCIHLPVGEAAESLYSISGGSSAKGYTRVKVRKDADEDKEEDTKEDSKPDSGQRDDISSRFVTLARVPEMEKILDDSSIQPLDHLASTAVRTFELLYRNRHTEFVFSSETVEDMRKYAQLLDSVYGELSFEATEKIPSFLRELPSALDLGGPRRVKQGAKGH
jgi:hypothetical protein